MYGHTTGDNPGIRARLGVGSANVFVRYGSGFSLVIGIGFVLYLTLWSPERRANFLRLLVEPYTLDLAYSVDML